MLNRLKIRTKLIVMLLVVAIGFIVSNWSISNFYKTYSVGSKNDLKISSFESNASDLILLKSHNE